MYDARTGVEWDWDGSPVTVALAAELGRVAANDALRNKDLYDLCGAVQLEALEALDRTPKVSEALGAPMQGALTLLRAVYRDSAAHSQVTDRMQVLAEEKP
jgi:hypothetical protein